MTGGTWLILTLLMPLAMLASCLFRPMRAAMPVLLPIAPLPGLIAALVVPDGASQAVPQLFGLTLQMDEPAALLLGASSLLWMLAGFSATDFLRGRSDAPRFCAWWLLTLAGSLGIFIAADLISFYLLFTIVSLAAYGLVVFDGSGQAQRAGVVYVAAALLGEAFLLFAFVILAEASPGHSLLIADAVKGLAAAPWGNAAIAALILGFGLKTGLVPLHVWMPLTYAAAPIPAAAVLSGAASKAGIIGLIRFLPVDSVPAGWGQALLLAGAFSAFYGVLIGITQRDPRSVLAYSSVSQLGLLAAVLGAGLAAGSGGVAIAIAFYCVHHILAKGGLFLAIGAVEQRAARRIGIILIPAAIVALGFGGLPLTGGALAKLAIKPILTGGFAGAVGILSAIASSVLMVHFILQLRSREPKAGQGAGNARSVGVWLAAAVATAALPWALFQSATSIPLAYPFTTAALWEAAWPVLTGCVMALVLFARGPLPIRIPEGDVLHPFERLVVPLAARSGDGMEWFEARLRQWPIACAVFLGIVIAFAVMLA
ncbi:complex I subunit 5 family protein [Aestuariivirga sp.]|uniref:complex I subunit 5 family protein n=1 Tax=Aestuariivirga sp. TaxID=2650926 RepID=UPI003BAB2D8B